MSLRAAIYSRCTSYSGLSALIGTRCYPDTVPEDANTGKFIVYRLISQPNYGRSKSSAGRCKSRIQFDCYDATGDGADALGAQVVAAWDNYAAMCNIGFAQKLNRSQVYVEGLGRYRQIVDVLIEHSASI